MPGNDADVLPIAHSILSGEGIARLVKTHYGFDPVNGCRLLRSGYNEVYALAGADGERRVARLGALRARGPADTEFEVSMLAHLAARGAVVAEPVRPLSGAAGVSVSMPEGTRWLALFEHVDGEPPESLDDMALTGEGLAMVHAAAEAYDGPASRYRCDVDHLLRTPLTWILASLEPDDPLCDQFRAATLAIESDFATLGPLSHVFCHGDCHGGNNLIRTTDTGERESVFFDFDDAAPGFLAYDLAVLLWSRLLGGGHATPTEEIAGDWNSYLDGYRRRRDLAPADLDAVPVFVRMRHILWLGERAGRRRQWGTVPDWWLGRQVGLLERWGSLGTGVV